jgi:hypothetical protein
VRGPVVLLSIVALLSIVLSLLPRTPLLAQGPAPGTPLRVEARGYTIAGELIRWGADSLVVRFEDGPAGRQAIAVSDILSLETAIPRSRGRGAARGALWGGAVGGILGAVVGALEARDCPCYLIESEADGAFWGGVIFGGLGLATGALAGAIVPGERWEPAELPPGAAAAP